MGPLTLGATGPLLTTFRKAPSPEALSHGVVAVLDLLPC
jgi:hypothetical protein